MRGAHGSLVQWAVLVVATAVAVVLLMQTPLPAAPLLGALAAATVLSIAGVVTVGVPRWSVLGSQALLGAMLGLELRPESLVVLADSWLAILIAVVATTALSIVTGLMLARSARVSRATGVMAMAAGGAAAITGMSQEVGSDRRLVVLTQYTRVLIVGFATPVLAALFWPRGRAVGVLWWLTRR